MPGLGTRAVDRILETRRYRRLRLEDVGAPAASIAKVTAIHHRRRLVAGRLTDEPGSRRSCAPAGQLSLF